MKFKDFVKQYNLNATAFEAFLKSTDAAEFKANVIISSWTDDISKIDDSIDSNRLVECFKQYEVSKAEKAKKAAQEKADAEARAIKAAQDKQTALAKMLITSGFNFDGYKITKYSGYISGDDAVQIPRSGSFGKSETNALLTDALVQIRRTAIAELKEAAYNLGCNAVIGVDFDYITMDPQTANFNGGTLYEPYVICVTANGNAVVIENTDE